MANHACFPGLHESFNMATLAKAVGLPCGVLFLLTDSYVCLMLSLIEDLLAAPISVLLT